jgi:hypothetical protein
MLVLAMEFSRDEAGGEAAFALAIDKR